MINSTEEKLEGTQEVVRRLNIIRASEDVQKFIANIKYEAENSGIYVKFKSRIKENESAINKYNKYIEEYGKADPEMWDSCGIMVIVENIEEVYEFIKFFEEKLTLRDDGLKDYVQNPKDGYRSIHMYLTFEAGSITIPSEIQIKTEAMSIAQDTIHDSIYKLKSIPFEKRNQLSEALFPIFEKCVDADRLANYGNVTESTRLRTDVANMQSKNEQLFSENSEIVNNSWKEFGKVLFIHHNLEEIHGSLFLKNADLTKEDKEKIKKQLEEALNKLFEYYCDNYKENMDYPSVSGDRKIDYAIQRLNRMGHSEFVKELKDMVDRESKQGQEKVEVASIDDFANIDSGVSPEARGEVWHEVLKAMTILSKDNEKAIGRA